MDLEDVWPLFSLRLRTPRLVLRPVRDADLPGLVAAALAGIHDPERTRFGVPRTDGTPAEVARSLVTYQWRLRANTSREHLDIGFVVELDGVPIGMQDLYLRDFDVLRTAETGSWLTGPRQGAGFGTEMRAALLSFVFDHLGAAWAVSGAMSWNAASLAVSRKLGYVTNGVRRVEVRPGEVAVEQLVRLGRADFVRPAWTPEVTGAEAVLDLLT